MTKAQKRVVGEILKDLSSERVMNRMLQGDVGSGKTAVAFQAILAVVESGYQAALMVPTEILAEQHHETVNGYLKKTSYRAALLSGSVKGSRRKRLLQELRKGQIHILVGTHALIQDAVEFENLALVVIDEQHRFGVLQRMRLLSKTEYPETLVMTATPIPRSLAMTLYGDLDLSVLDEIPPGRGVVKTVVRGESERETVYSMVRHELEKGRQGFVIFPAIEASGDPELKAAKEMSEFLQGSEFPEFKVGLIHGRLTPEQRDLLMKEFKSGQVDLMVSTTVVEVGIDIPNATVMIVEHADRFGLSQLHQLRGRIGRGRFPGLCVLMTDVSDNEQALRRLAILCSSNDGFEIAEQDLQIRGPGELAGTRQSGMPEFVFGQLVRDWEVLELAHREAVELAKQSVTLDSVPLKQAGGFLDPLSRIDSVGL